MLCKLAWGSMCAEIVSCSTWCCASGRRAQCVLRSSPARLDVVQVGGGLNVFWDRLLLDLMLCKWAKGSMCAEIVSCSTWCCASERKVQYVLISSPALLELCKWVQGLCWDRLLLYIHILDVVQVGAGFNVCWDHFLLYFMLCKWAQGSMCAEIASCSTWCCASGSRVKWVLRSLTLHVAMVDLGELRHKLMPVLLYNSVMWQFASIFKYHCHIFAYVNKVVVSTK